jgi:hypothetical protein
MKSFLLFIISAVCIISCKTSKDYLSRGDEDRTLYDIVKKLNKRSNDADAVNALPEVYSRVQQNHLKKIADFTNSRDILHWDRLLAEYNSLQNIYESISNSGPASRLVNAVNYQNQILETRQAAAADYYDNGLILLGNGSRDNLKTAYNYFKKTEKYVSGFKDAAAKMAEAYDNATISVVINPIQDNSFFLNTGWGNNGYNYSNEYFQETLIRDLGGTYASRYPAKFYTERQAKRADLQPDWLIDIRLRDMDVPHPKQSSQSRNVTTSVESGKDTSGRPVYQKVSATVFSNIKNFTARCRMDMTITDIKAHRDISYNTYTEDYSWQEITYSYTGDYRALTRDDLDKINNTQSPNQQPRKEEILNQLYRKIYPQIKNKITYEVGW